MDRIKVANAGEIEPGTIRIVFIDEMSFAICNVDGELYAIDNICPHRGALLGQGTLDSRILTCPWHQWKFDVTTGKGITNPLSCVKKYALETAEGEIFLLK